MRWGRVIGMNGCRLSRRLLAGCLSLGCVVGAATSAIAAPVGGADDTDPKDISCKTANLRIVLPEHNPDPAAEGTYPYGDGSGYTFSLSRVKGLDVKDPSQWDTIQKLTPESARKAGVSPLPEKHVTGQDKTVRFNGLSVGVYLVTVTPPHIAGQLNPGVADFVVTAPMADVDGWKCDATIWAKTVPSVSVAPTLPPTSPAAPPSIPPARPNLPRTGSDLIDTLGIAGTGVLGGVLVLLGIGGTLAARARRKNQFGE